VGQLAVRTADSAPLFGDLTITARSPAPAARATARPAGLAVCKAVPARARACQRSTRAWSSAQHSRRAAQRPAALTSGVVDQVEQPGLDARPPAAGPGQRSAPTRFSQMQVQRHTPAQSPPRAAARARPGPRPARPAPRCGPAGPAQRRPTRPTRPARQAVRQIEITVDRSTHLRNRRGRDHRDRDGVRGTAEELQPSHLRRPQRLVPLDAPANGTLRLGVNAYGGWTAYIAAYRYTAGACGSSRPPRLAHPATSANSRSGGARPSGSASTAKAPRTSARSA
jgi:hypothetical protein